jgi:hypothetical protein
MPDTNEERLLSELLGDISNADADLAASDELGRRVMAGWDASDAQARGSRRGTPDSPRPTMPRRPWVVALGAAALGTAALVLAVSAVIQPGFLAKTARIDPVGQTPPPAIATSQPKEVVVVQDAPELLRRPLMRRATPRRTQVVPGNEIVSFVPLVPMTADELSGSFSIARVQIGQTEADVLLGEDGMARAIRVSTHESAPGRLR